MSKITFPAGITSLTQYVAALQMTVERLNDAASNARSELYRIQAAQRAEMMKAKKPKTVKPVAVAKPIELDVTKPLSTQVQVIAKQCGLSFSSVYNEKTKTKGRKIKLHRVYKGKIGNRSVLTKAKYKEFCSALLKVMTDNNVVVNSIEMQDAPEHSSDWTKVPSITVFFAE